MILERTTNHKGEITQVTYDQIKSASAGSWHSTEFENEKIPTFDDVITFANETHMNINVELKGFLVQTEHVCLKVWCNKLLRNLLLLKMALM